MGSKLGPETFEDQMTRFLWACLIVAAITFIPAIVMHEVITLLRTPTMDCNRFWGLCWQLLDPGWYN
jgi:hypothetical protein